MVAGMISLRQLLSGVTILPIVLVSETVLGVGVYALVLYFLSPEVLSNTLGFARQALPALRKT